MTTLLILAALAVVACLPFWGAALALGGSLIGGEKDRKAQSGARRDYQHAQGKAMAQWLHGYNKAGGFDAMALDSLNKGEQAFRSVGDYGARSIKQQGFRDILSMGQTMADRGLGATTASLAANRAVSGQNANALSAFLSQLGGAKGQFYNQRAGALSDLGERDYMRRLDLGQIWLGPQAAPQLGAAESYGKLGGQLGEMIGSVDWGSPKKPGGGSPIATVYTPQKDQSFSMQHTQAV